MKTKCLKSENMRVTKAKSIIVCMWFFVFFSVSAGPQGILFNNFWKPQKPSNSSRSPDTLKVIVAPPKCPRELPLCEDVDTYPHELVKRVLEGNHTLKMFFGKDQPPNEELGRRDDQDRFVCRSYTITIFPKVGQNAMNEWKYILNQEEKDGFVQGVQVEICRSPEKSCDIPGSIAFGYQTSCKQKYSYRRLLSLSNMGNPEVETFKIPSACSCAYKKSVTDFMARSNP